MNLKEAINILEHHNKWRCDNSVPSKYEQTDAIKLTKAINVVVDSYRLIDEE